MKRMIGCVTRGFIFLVLVGIIVAVAMSYLGGDSDPKKHALIGEILVFADEGITINGETCTAPSIAAGENMHIEDGSTDGVNVTLESGIVTPEGNCSFEFIAEVGETDLYGFTINGNTVLRKDETIGKEIPDDYRHSSASDGEWWVSIWAKDFND